MTGYEKWQKRLAGEKVMTFLEPDENDVGFYRRPITEKGVNAKTGKANGKTKIIGWEPVAYYMADGMLCGRIGNRNITNDDDIWTWCCAHPISEEWYRAVAEDGKPWPDAMAEIPAANRDVAKTDNEPFVGMAEEFPEISHATAIDLAIGAALKVVTNEIEAAQALGSKNRIAELRLAADKAGKAIYEPMYRVYTAEQKKWSPIIARATAKEKELNTAILTFRESERKRVATEQAEADRKQREIDEVNARAADRAIARGEPEQRPEVVETEQPSQLAPVVATYGTRKFKEEMKLILDKVTSWDMLFAHYKNNVDVQALLMKLASADIKAGHQVPGTTTREGLI